MYNRTVATATEDTAMKLPTYTPREENALRTAHSVVLRALVGGTWRSSGSVKEEHESFAECILRAQAHVRHVTRHTPGAARVMVCVVGRDPTDREDFIVPMPADYLPSNARQLLP